jgi:hypothetical protein
MEYMPDLRMERSCTVATTTDPLHAVLHLGDPHGLGGQYLRRVGASHVRDRATGLPPLALSFFGAASTAIVIPGAVAVFAWLATTGPGRGHAGFAQAHRAGGTLDVFELPLRRPDDAALGPQSITTPVSAWAESATGVQLPSSTTAMPGLSVPLRSHSPQQAPWGPSASAFHGSSNASK